MDGSSGESSRGVDSGMTVVAVGCTTSGSASIGAVSTVTTIGVGVGIGISVGSGVGVAGIDVGVAGTDVGVDITALAVVSMGLLEVGSSIAGDPHAIVPAIKDRIAADINRRFPVYAIICTLQSIYLSIHFTLKLKKKNITWLTR